MSNWKNNLRDIGKGILFVLTLVLNAILAIMLFQLFTNDVSQIRIAVYTIYGILVMGVDSALILYFGDDREHCRDCGKLTEWSELCKNMQTQPYYDDICDSCWKDKY